MSLLLARSVKYLRPKTRITSSKSQRSGTNLRRYSSQKKGHSSDEFADSFSSVSERQFQGGVDPRSIEEQRATKQRAWVLAIGASMAAISYAVYNTDYFSQRQLNRFSPELLDEEKTEEVHAQIRNVAFMCIKHKSIESSIMGSPAYSALRKAVYSEDKYVRLLALRALAALARNSRDVRKRIAQTMDFQRLASEIYTEESVKKNLASDGPAAMALVTKYLRITSPELEKELSPRDLDELLVHAFDDIVSVSAFDDESHVKLLPLGYVDRAVDLIQSPCYHVRVGAIRAVAGLTRSVEGRQALAKTAVFPMLYNMIYPNETRDKLLKSDSKNFATYAMQQLLLSESAMDIMLPRYEPFFHAMTQAAKEDLLMKFDLHDEIELAKGLHIAKQAGLGFSFGIVWGGLRSLLLSQWVPGQKRPQIRMNSVRNIIAGAANGSTGAVPLIGIYLLLNLLNESLLVKLSDTKATYSAAATGLAASVAAVAGLTLNIFPYSLVPTIVGLAAPQILAVVPGTSEHEITQERQLRKGTPNSDEE